MKKNFIKATTVSIFVFMLFFHSYARAQQSETQEIFPLKANFVSEKEADKVFKNSQRLIIKGSKGYSRGTYLKFDNIQFKNNPIKKAELVLQCEKMGNESTNDVHVIVGVVSDNWSEDKISWKNSPIPKSTAGKTVIKSKGPVKIDITDFIKKIAQEKKTRFSLVLADLKKSGRLVFIFGLSNQNNKPRIKINYK